ncbi:LmbU family transcriptional regulator [Micromonospora sp. NPDC051925]|uniref:LmbU family transcriptional regulator n=1 Tax=Micromonospora sp. NPDC051925 TaxID=3364288 RepID=UPI0037C5C16D
MTRVGLQIPPELTYDGWEQAGKRIADVVDSSAWCLGDWLLYGQDRYSDRYRRAVEAVGLDYQTIRNYVWVARRFGLARRRSTLSFQHHAEVAALPDAEQDRWLDLAEQGQWSRNELRRQVRAAARGLGTDKLPAAGVPRLEVQQERIERWRTAAELSERSLESWMLSCLDAQAEAVLSQQDASEPPAPDKLGGVH